MGKLNKQEQDALHSAETLNAVTREIIDLKQPSDLPRLNHLLMERGRLIQRIGELPVRTFSETVRQQLQACLDQQQAWEQTIREGFQQMKADVQEQLQQIAEGKKLVQKYKIELDQSLTSTRSRDA